MILEIDLVAVGSIGGAEDRDEEAGDVEFAAELGERMGGSEALDLARLGGGERGGVGLGRPERRRELEDRRCRGVVRRRYGEDRV